MSIVHRFLSLLFLFWHMLWWHFLISIRITCNTFRGLVHKSWHANFLSFDTSRSKKCNGRAVVKKQNIFPFSFKNSTEIVELYLISVLLISRPASTRFTRPDNFSCIWKMLNVLPSIKRWLLVTCQFVWKSFEIPIRHFLNYSYSKGRTRWRHLFQFNSKI